MDWKRNNKINVGHNLSTAFDFHDVVRTLIVRKLRRNYPDSFKIPIYTEYYPEKSLMPDIYIKIKNKVYIYEIQEQMNSDWITKLLKNYGEDDLIIVSLKTLREKWLVKLDVLIHNDYDITEINPIKELNKLLDDYII